MNHARSLDGLLLIEDVAVIVLGTRYSVLEARVQLVLAWECEGYRPRAPRRCVDRAALHSGFPCGTLERALGCSKERAVLWTAPGGLQWSKC